MTENQTDLQPTKEKQTDLQPTKEKQEKALTLFCVRASHNCPQCGQFQGFQSTLFCRGKP